MDFGRYNLVTTAEDIAAWCKACSDAGHCAVDTETTGFDWQTDEIVSIQLAYVGSSGDIEACYIPLAHTEKAMCGLPQASWEDITKYVKPLMEDARVEKVFQNALFDMLFLRARSIEVNNVHDTMLLSYVLDVTKTRHNMGDIAVRHLDGRPTIPFEYVVLADDLLTIPNFSHVRIDDAVAYAAEDADVTLAAFAAMEGKASDDDWRIYDGIDRQLLPSLLDMKWRGVTLDINAMKAASDEWNARADEAYERIQEQAPGLDVSSPKALGDYIFGTLGIKPPKVSRKTGAASVDKETLEKLGDSVPFVSDLLELRKLEKLVSTYSEALPAKVSPISGRLHPSINQCTTATGRFSGSDPNPQNIPKKGEGGTVLRKSFIAAPGCKLVVADYSNIEFRVLAQITKEPTIIRAFHEDMDLHALTMQDAWGYDYDEIIEVIASKGKHPRFKEFDDIRRDAKVIGFGVLYGMTEIGLAAKLKIAPDEAALKIERFFDGKPKVAGWVQRQHNVAVRDREVFTLLGRRLPLDFSGGRGGAERQSVNYPIQGSAADLMRLAMVKFQRLLVERDIPAYQLLTVHDELIAEVEDGYEDEAIDAMREAMVTATDGWGIDWVIPIIAEPVAALTWGDAK